MLASATVGCSFMLGLEDFNEGPDPSSDGTPKETTKGTVSAPSPSPTLAPTPAQTANEPDAGRGAPGSADAGTQTTKVLLEEGANCAEAHACAIGLVCCAMGSVFACSKKAACTTWKNPVPAPWNIPETFGPYIRCDVNADCGGSSCDGLHNNQRVCD